MEHTSPALCIETPSTTIPSCPSSPVADTLLSHETGGTSASATQPHWTLSKDETEYLRQLLPTYVANNNQGANKKKGAKGQWIIDNILPDFKTRFNYSSKNADSPKMDVITTVCFIL
jgi:hypothetical protein